MGTTKHEVAVIKYEKPLESLRKAVDMAGGLKGISSATKVVIKPNFCQWYEGVNFPKYGVLTTARLIHDIVILLKEQGVEDISIVEGVVEIVKRPESILQLIVRGMGIDILSKRYGIKLVDALKGSFEKITVGDMSWSMNKDILEADYVINIPVLKTHSQVMVSLGIKNLKGVLNIASRKKCHRPDSDYDLNYHLALLPGIISPSLTILDGIYTLERGPLITGKAHRSDVIVASKDVISADKVGSTILGIDPATVPYLAQAAKNNDRPVNLGDTNVKGDIDIHNALQPHGWEFKHSESGNQPLFFERVGIQGITYPHVDTTMCTYCADFISYINLGIIMANNRDKPFDDIEIIHGKRIDPEGGHIHTLLVGQCQVKRNAKNPLINHCVEINGCPPCKEDLLEAYAELGIELPDDFIERMGKYPESFMKKYMNQPGFDESFYRVQEMEP